MDDIEAELSMAMLKLLQYMNIDDIFKFHFSTSLWMQTYLWSLLLSTQKVTFQVERSENWRYICVCKLLFEKWQPLTYLITSHKSQKQNASQGSVIRQVV